MTCISLSKPFQNAMSSRFSRNRASITTSDASDFADSCWVTDNSSMLVSGVRLVGSRLQAYTGGRRPYLEQDGHGFAQTGVDVEAAQCSEFQRCRFPHALNHSRRGGCDA